MNLAGSWKVTVAPMIRSSSVGAARPLPDLTHMPPRWGLRRFCLGAGTFHKPASRQAGLWSQCAPEGLETINMPLLTELSDTDGDMTFSGWELGTEGSRGRKGRPPRADVTATARALPTLISGAYEFEPKRLEPAPQLISNRLVFKVPPSRVDRCGSNGAQT